MTARRPTRQRAALTEMLAQIPEFVSAQDLHTRLAAAGSSVGLATVYRNLQALADDGEVDVLRTDTGEALYRACRSATHHHHVVCRVCGRTVEVEGPPGLNTWSQRVSDEHGFREVTHTLEVFGVCATHQVG